MQKPFLNPTVGRGEPPAEYKGIVSVPFIVVMVVAGVPFKLIRLSGWSSNEVIFSSNIGDFRVKAHNLSGAVALDAAFRNHASIGIALGGQFQCAESPWAIDDEVRSNVGALGVTCQEAGVWRGGNGQVVAGFNVHTAGNATEEFCLEGNTAISSHCSLHLLPASCKWSPRRLEWG